MVSVKLHQGQLCGLDLGALSVFHAVPYAKAARFQAPDLAPPWTGVLDATRPGPVCPQSPSRVDFIMGSPKVKRDMSEDCQLLSVFTPDLKGCRPVMLWIHGGAFITGGGQEQWNDAARLAQDGDVVIVTINYRLGAFGYLYAPELGTINPGLQDQLAALRWVYENIEQFGGDTENITIFGQSAGGHSVASILATPDRAPVRRAIIQSAPLGEAFDAARATLVAREFMDFLGQSPLEASVDDILMAQAKVMANSNVGLPFRPMGDPNAFTVGPGSKLDVLIGWGKDDAAPFVALKHPEQAYGSMDDKVQTQELTSEIFSAPARSYAARLRDNGVAVSLYQNEWHPMGSPFGTCHCIELPLLFASYPVWEGAPMLGRANQEEIERLGFQARVLWTEFARSGTPPESTGWLTRPNLC